MSVFRSASASQLTCMCRCPPLHSLRPRITQTMFAFVRSRRDPNKIENIRSDPDMFVTRCSQEEAYRKGISSLFPSPLFPSSPPPPIHRCRSGADAQARAMGEGKGDGRSYCEKGLHYCPRSGRSTTTRILHICCQTIRILFTQRGNSERRTVVAALGGHQTV